jgi:hypothetical protein
MLKGNVDSPGTPKSKTAESAEVAHRRNFRQHLYRVCKKNHVWLGSGTSAWAFTVLS